MVPVAEVIRTAGKAEQVRQLVPREIISGPGDPPSEQDQVSETSRGGRQARAPRPGSCPRGEETVRQELRTFGSREGELEIWAFSRLYPEGGNTGSTLQNRKPCRWGGLVEVPDLKDGMQFPFRWLSKGFLYLRIFITPAFHQLYKANYVQLLERIKQDLQQWKGYRYDGYAE
ncbi:uncharacterized protein [Chiloscyllium punctatum]|uniref:uncharacterized protein isoform X4 n=1 Tax=Chiloscyllium punctatum TaxID=137246 RepID=UPI003B641F9C